MIYLDSLMPKAKFLQVTLKSLLSSRMISYLNPDEDKSQFQRTRSFTDGLNQASEAFRERFKVIARGMSRPYWAESPEALAAVGNIFLFSFQINRDIANLPPLSLTHPRILSSQCRNLISATLRQILRHLVILAHNFSVLCCVRLVLRRGWCARCSRYLSLQRSKQKLHRY